MAKDFKKNTHQALTGNTTTETKSYVSDGKESDFPRKPGRPKTKKEPTKTINIAVPVSMLEKLEVAKACYGNNMTQYVNALIATDIEKNFEQYETIYNGLNNIKHIK
jgi:hypothetical protein